MADSGFLSRTARHIGRFKVQERVYTDCADGSRVLKYAKGKEIPFAEAIAAGLVDPDHIPADAVQAILPRDVYENGRLVGRAGKVVSVADLERFGFLSRDEPEEPAEPVRTDEQKSKVRTAKVPAPPV